MRQVSDALAYRQVCSKFICVHTDPQLITYAPVGDILSRTIVIEPRMLLDVIPRQYAHRETSAEFMLNNGYSFNFDFYDMYTSGKKFNHQKEQDSSLTLSNSAEQNGSDNQACENLNKFS